MHSVPVLPSPECGLALWLKRNRGSVRLFALPGSLFSEAL